MTDPNWKVQDYYFSFPDIPRYKGPATAMPIQHKVHQLQISFLEIMREVKKCLQADAELAALVLCLVAVDYLAGYYSGRKSTGDDFVKFMFDYFPDKYRSYNEYIYSQVRCGLLHNLAAINPWKSERNSFRIHSDLAPHLEEGITEEGKTYINFSVPTFFEDVRRAFVRYAHDVIMKSQERTALEKNFNKRFNRLEGRGAFLMKTSD